MQPSILASNSLLECLVFGKRAILKASENLIQTMLISESNSNKDIVADSSMEHYKSLHQKIQSIFTEKVGIVRHEVDLYRGFMEIDKIIEQLPKISSDIFVEKGRDLLILARSIIKSALYREESRGAHQRSNFPDSSADYYGHVVIKNSEINFEKIDENGH